MDAPSDNAPTHASSLASRLQISEEEVERRYNVVKSVSEQCINDDELRDLLAKKAAPVCYDGFEPSGRMHIAQGLMKIMSVKKLTSAGLYAMCRYLCMGHSETDELSAAHVLYVCMQCADHSETDELSAAHALYVCMQCADTSLFLKADICQLGMDQQTVNLLARDYFDETERGNKE